MRRWLGARSDRRGRGRETSARERPDAASDGRVLAALPVVPEGTTDQRELVRPMLAILFVAGLIAATFWILWPFLPAIIWATTLVVATFPLMLRVQHRLWNSRGLAVAIMTVALLLVFVVPFSLAVAAITQNFERIVGWAKALASFQLPPPPAWLIGLPLFGEPLARMWQRVIDSGIDVWAAKAA